MLFITFWGSLYATRHRLDIAKRVFQLHSVDPSSGEIQKVKLQRAELLRHFGTMSPAVVAMEACGSSNHWARRFTAMGHEVRLIATNFVRPFVKRAERIDTPDDLMRGGVLLLLRFSSAYTA